MESLVTGIDGVNLSPLRSVDTPVEYNPLEATASEPPKSTVMIESAQLLFVVRSRRV